MGKKDDEEVEEARESTLLPAALHPPISPLMPPQAQEQKQLPSVPTEELPLPQPPVSTPRAGDAYDDFEGQVPAVSTEELPLPQHLVATLQAGDSYDDFQGQLPAVSTEELPLPQHPATAQAGNAYDFEDENAEMPPDTVAVAPLPVTVSASAAFPVVTEMARAVNEDMEVLLPENPVTAAPMPMPMSLPNGAAPIATHYETEVLQENAAAISRGGFEDEFEDEFVDEEGTNKAPLPPSQPQLVSPPMPPALLPPANSEDEKEVDDDYDDEFEDDD